MNKYQEALENIGMIDLDEESNGYDNPKYLKDFYFGEYCILEELVEKATPKKCYIIEEHIKNGWTIRAPIPMCPICDKPIQYHDNYCSNCGQKLLWEEK